VLAVPAASDGPFRSTMELLPTSNPKVWSFNSLEGSGIGSTVENALWNLWMPSHKPKKACLKCL